MPLPDQIGRTFDRIVHLSKRAALAFGLSAISAIMIGAAATDNGFVQLLVTLFATIALWVPILLTLLWGERLFRRSSAPASSQIIDAVATPVAGQHWQRLARAAPDQRERIHGLQLSIERSRVRLSTASFDPQATDLCVLINRRLPDLIDRQLDALPPDDRGRREQVNELVNLVDQFARHCSRHGADDTAVHEREAEILRRRFEDHLAPPPFDGQ